ncbi:hypothetical protein D3C72_1015720 [compost metagenome]
MRSLRARSWESSKFTGRTTTLSPRRATSAPEAEVTIWVKLFTPSGCRPCTSTVTDMRLMVPISPSIRDSLMLIWPFCTRSVVRSVELPLALPGFSIG